jgi:TPR repeat protein
LSRSVTSPWVTSACVAMGQYYLTGIPNSDIKPDAIRAFQYFTLAANLGDADGQYRLGRMYLDGQGVAKAPFQAARWFYQAAMKGHYEAQAEFGRLLFKGAPGGVPREGAKGLMWLKIAVDNAPNGVTAPQDVYNSALKQATEEERSAAAVYYEQSKQRGYPGR